MVCDLIIFGFDFSVGGIKAMNDNFVALKLEVIDTIDRPYNYAF
jgi:hypothetical protein